MLARCWQDVGLRVYSDAAQRDMLDYYRSHGTCNHWAPMYPCTEAVKRRACLKAASICRLIYSSCRRTHTAGISDPKPERKWHNPFYSSIQPRYHVPTLLVDSRSSSRQYRSLVVEKSGAAAQGKAEDGNALHSHEASEVEVETPPTPVPDFMRASKFKI